jgi:predicted HTH transcriptional regulator
VEGNNNLQADEVYAHIRQGESQTLAFKETLSLDTAKQTKEEYIEISTLRTISAFFNTAGGIILIGVSDNGDILGIDAEVEKLHEGILDKFLLSLKNLIKSRIGMVFFPYISYTIVDVCDRKVLRIECKESPKLKNELRITRKIPKKTPNDRIDKLTKFLNE